MPRTPKFAAQVLKKVLKSRIKNIFTALSGHVWKLPIMAKTLDWVVDVKNLIGRANTMTRIALVWNFVSLAYTLVWIIGVKDKVSWTKTFIGMVGIRYLIAWTT